MEQTPLTQPHPRLNNLVRISTRYNNVIIPIDLRQLAPELIKNGYAIVAPPLPEELPTQPSIIGGSLNPYARKGNTVIDIDTIHQHIGIKEINSKMAIERYKELDKILKSLLIGGKYLKAWFTEYQNSFKIRTKENSWKLISKKMGSNEMSGILSKFVENDVGVSQIKYTWPSERPDMTNYFEFILTPTLVDEHLFDFTLIFRYSNNKKFLEQAERIDGYIEKVITWLETDNSK